MFKLVHCANVIAVSSRAPVWGASRAGGKREKHNIVSSRAPVWGASNTTDSQQGVRDVSSRAPVWGASRNKIRRGTQPEFQVVPPCGGHPGIFWYKRENTGFQVVPPCGGHHATKSGEEHSRSFKSCPRVGGIQTMVGRLQALQVSSRAPVWGASVILHKKHVANLCKICIFLPNCRF